MFPVKELIKIASRLHAMVLIYVPQLLGKQKVYV